MNQHERLYFNIKHSLLTQGFIVGVITHYKFQFSCSSEENVSQRVARTVTGAWGTATNAIYWTREYWGT